MMYFVWNQWVFGLIGLLISEPLWAAKSEIPTLGEIAGKLMVGTDFITKLVLVFAIVIGVFLIITALTHFRNHHLNPKFVPLDRPIIYLLLGLALLSIPFWGDVFLPTTSTIDLKKKQVEAVTTCPVDIDAPLEMGNEFNH